jgi:nucleotide-binding universal stress UspA family protein
LKDLDAKTMVGAGAIDDALLNVVVEKDINLIVMGTHGRTGVRRLLLGSAVEAVCRVATCPVLTVGPSLAAKPAIAFSRILFPTDLSEDSKRILPYLRQVAEGSARHAGRAGRKPRRPEAYRTDSQQPGRHS